MPRIFKYGDILNITFTPDEELNILIYRSPCNLIIYRSHTLLKMVRFFWPTLYIMSQKSDPCVEIFSTLSIVGLSVFFNFVTAKCSLHYV